MIQFWQSEFITSRNTMTMVFFFSAPTWHFLLVIIYPKTIRHISNLQVVFEVPSHLAPMEVRASPEGSPPLLLPVAVNRPMLLLHRHLLLFLASLILWRLLGVSPPCKSLSESPFHNQYNLISRRWSCI
ncbi:unnamed protein product [Rodentolepis nana]|uniref:Uncharacterized protein n=1 Tax=Rodentolepis nana TaxID=102285 RepID=A0A3P7S2X8_RODNA|nr:unnamed protein product [Rodentolepis nana]